jgi:hypothetical protein
LILFLKEDACQKRSLNLNRENSNERDRKLPRPTTPDYLEASGNY